MKKGVRVGLGILLAVVFVLGACSLMYWYIQSEKNAQANQEAQFLIDIPESEPPMAEMPDPSANPPVSEPSWEPAEEQTMLPTEKPEPEDPPVSGFEDPVIETLRNTELKMLQEKNPDVVAWIAIPNTPISYPVLQGEDNAFYLKHNWKKERNSGGSIFMECKNSADFTDFNTLVYGHRMRDSSMFNALQYYEDADFLAEHPRIYIVTDESVLVYDIFASGRVTITDPVYWLITDQERYKQPMIDFCLENSAVDTGIVPIAADRLLTLSTCTSVRGSDYRWVVVATQAAVVKPAAAEE